MTIANRHGSDSSSTPAIETIEIGQNSLDRIPAKVPTTNITSAAMTEAVRTLILGVD